MLERNKIRMNTIQTQMEFIVMLRARHFDWGNENTGSQIISTHLEIADLLEKLAKKYLELEQLYNFRGGG